MPTVHANGIGIRYEIISPAHPEALEGPVAQGPSPERAPLVLTHGFAGPIDDWRDEVLPLAEKRTLVLYDVRGHGRSSIPADAADYSMPAFAADLAALLNAIGIERAHIGGVSMGGMITAQFAVDFPQMCASVLLCDTTCGNGVDAGSGGDWERRMKVGISALGHIAGKYGLEESVRRQQEWDQANNSHLAESPYNPAGDYQRIKLMTVDGYVGAAHAIAERPDLSDRIREIKAPTLVMVGEWDDFVPCALRDHELIPCSRLVVRQRCGHGSRWRLPTFLSEVESFLGDVEAGRPVAGEREV